MTHSSCRNDPARCDDRFGLLHGGQLEESEIRCHTDQMLGAFTQMSLTLNS